MSLFEKDPQHRDIYVVRLSGKSLAGFEQEDFVINYYGQDEELSRDERNLRGLSGKVAMYHAGILQTSYGKPWNVQEQTIAEANAELILQNAPWRIIVPPNPASAIEVTQEVYRQHGINILHGFTRVGNGSVFVGCFHPRFGVDVNGLHDPSVSFNDVGVLPLLVPA